MITQSLQDELSILMDNLSDGDVSTLEASLKTPDSQMMTVEGSANYLLWSRFEQAGWMDSRTEKIPLPNGGVFQAKVFTITEKGFDPISQIISALLEKRFGRPVGDAPVSYNKTLRISAKPK